MFSVTPPPSEFDEFDKTTTATLLTCRSPPLSGLCYPSPTPSHRAHAPSVSSESIYIRRGMSLSDDRQHESHPVFFEDNSLSPSFFSVASIPDTDPMAQYTTSAPYQMYDQSGWLSFPTYSENTSAHLLHDSSSTPAFPPFDPSTHPSMANIIPPTPQDLQPVPFDFNSPPPMPSAPHHLTASPSFSQISQYSNHSQRSSISSTSRSCSPNPSLYRPNSSNSAGSSTLNVRTSIIRSSSTSSTSSLQAYGIPVSDPIPSRCSSNGQRQPQCWRCAYPGCTSRATFTRGCDLRKHYNRHSKHLFCRVEGCPQSEAIAAAKAGSDGQLSGGFSSKKDRARHEAKHNPGIRCEWRGPEGEECGRIFSRMDNMKDHVRRIHNKGQQQQHQPSHYHSTAS